MARRGGSDAAVARVLGVSCDLHDAAACLVEDGRIVSAVEQERLSRSKHDPGLPVDAIDACLRIAGIGPDDVDVVAFYEKPLTALQRFLAVHQRIGPRSLPSFVRNLGAVALRNVFVEYRVGAGLRQLGATRPVPVRYATHHRSHAAAAFFPSPFRHAAILTVDGVGEWATASISRGSHHRIEALEELRYPDSVGLLYSFMTAYCGFRANDDEFKVMGLAPYGEPRFVDALGEIAELAADGSVRIDPESLGWYGPAGFRARRLQAVLGGPPRRPGDALGQREADLAASVQVITEQAILSMAAHAREVTGESALCLGGGVALNCVANGRLLRDGPFEQVWIQPAAGDAGSAIGAALWYWHEVLGRPRTPCPDDAMAGAFLGPRVAPDEVDRWVAARGLPSIAFTSLDDLAEDVARRLDAGGVVGWFQGRMEFGPRALGHRSILADPRDPSVRERLNRVVKGREDFRPFGPAVLADHAASWFDLDAPSPYMLVVAPLRPERTREVEAEPTDFVSRAALVRSDVPACTHVDGTARIQTVDATTNPELHRLLSAFHRRTGCPMLVNTSFNVAGEPIVASPDDALRTARTAGLDALVIEHHLIESPAAVPCSLS